MVDCIEPHFAMEGACAVERRELPQKIIRPLPSRLYAVTQRPPGNPWKDPVYAVKTPIFPTSGFDGPAMNRRSQGPHLMSQPVRGGRPIPADGMFRAPLGRTGIG